MGTSTLTLTRSASPLCNKIVTFEELEQQYGGDRSSWTALYGRVYDISEFLTQHPGGSILRYAAGRDATSLYESYHATYSRAKCEAALNKYCTYIGDLDETPCACHSNVCEHTVDDSFFRTVSERVDAYLVQRGGRHALEEWNKVEAIVTLVLYCVTSYYASVYGSLFGAICLGVLTGRMGFLMHSGNHCAIARSTGWNTFVGIFMDIVGSSHYIWGYEHQVAHHMSPNAFKKDNDCEIGNPMFRFHPLIADLRPNGPNAASSVDRFARRNQHWLIPILMSIGFFKWFVNDIQFFLQGRAGNVQVPVTRPLWAWIIACKAVWLLIHVILPVYYCGLSRALLLVVLFMAIGAQYLENVFIVNHIQEDCQVPLIELERQQERAKGRRLHWAVQQVCTTTNWASRSHVANFLSGGLNHQVEHHLFPAMCTHLYPSIAPIVQVTCAEYGLPYLNYTTFGAAWCDMYCYLKKLGQNKKLDSNHTSGHSHAGTIDPVAITQRRKKLAASVSSHNALSATGSTISRIG